MGEYLIKPYEISVWKNELIQDGNEQRFVERKLAIIGSNTMTGLNKAYDPVFNKKMNGEKSLTFSLKYKYIDTYTGEEVTNPFVSLLTNESRVKLHYDDKWYEFTVKEHKESSEESSWEYTCTDAFVLELSKQGYNITFDSELNNNQGTAMDLAEQTLKDTNWRVGNNLTSRQLVAEPLYKGTIQTSFEVFNTDTRQNETVVTGEQVYVFYSYISNKDGLYVQFMKQNGSNRTIDDNNVITSTNYRIMRTNLTFEETAENDVKIIRIKSGNVTLILLNGIENLYKGNRLVYNQLNTYDPVMQRTVARYKSGDREIYRYTDYEYTTSNILTNFITNGESFNVLEDGTLQGWNQYVGGNLDHISEMELATWPRLETGQELADLTALSEVEGFLKINFKNSVVKGPECQYLVYNSGMSNNAAFINSISVGDEFVFRWRACTDLENKTPNQNLRLLVAKYTQDQPQRWGYYYKHIDEADIVLDFTTGTPQKLNNIIEGGFITDNEDGSQSYKIDDVAQTISTKYTYKNGTDGLIYAWVPAQQRFTVANDSNYLPYYYLRAKATKGITNEDLADPLERYGIFIYTIGNPGAYYIEDIQLTRYIPNKDSSEPITIGNVPNATSLYTDYYYVKPDEGAKAEEIITYKDLDTLEEETGIQDIIPMYNEDAIKYLSITASHSNCFDILQTISETFQCWIDLVVDHDDSGYITYTDGAPNKYVYLNEYAGKDNFAGFKYGINLQSIERDINSDEIVTKLIVEESQSEYTDTGFISIASSSYNTSGEAYILNFDYYYNQGLLDRDTAEADRLQFIHDVALINLELKQKEEQRRQLETAISEIRSKLNVFTETVETAKDTKNRALGQFEAATGETYDSYRQRHTSLPTDKQLTQEESIVKMIGELYVASSLINTYAGYLTNIEKEYEEKRKELYGSENYHVVVSTVRDANNDRHVIVELNDYLPGFTFTIGDYTGESTVSKKYFDIISNAPTITFTAPSGYTSEVSSYSIRESKVFRFKVTSNTNYYGIVDDIDDLLARKDEVVTAFNRKYSDYIQEGTWSSTDYIDSNLYYLDALQVSNTSAQPVLTYTINVVEISELEGFEWYKFDVGDKTYVEDTEFFGWTKVNGVLTPIQEEVIVAEVEWHLDEADKNTITVQNYKTRFEDLFQRISATVQTVNFNETTYAKISQILQANNVINSDVLAESLNDLNGQKFTLTSNGSVYVDGDAIYVRNLTNRSNLVIINSDGIRISSDGGTNYTTAISGEGINIGTVFAGTLNTREVIIGNPDDPSFRWDASGISAYGTQDLVVGNQPTYKRTEDTILYPNKTYYTYDETNDEYVEVPSEDLDVTLIDTYYEVQTIYDLQTYVRFDKYGLYGIKNGEFFKASNISDIENKAHFGITWHGFFIKNSYTGGGQVKITSDNDFQITTTTPLGIEQEKIKIGALEWTQGGTRTTVPIPGVAPDRYGIRIRNNIGNVVFETDDNGDISITGTINATGGNFSGLVNVGPTNQNHIEINGISGANTPYIRSSNYSDAAGAGWLIDKDGNAYFDNITARGAIKTAVFEYAEIQSVGGVFLFRPSSTIRSAAIATGTDDLHITVENSALFKVGDWCKVSNYFSGNTPPDTVDPVSGNILQNNGLLHVYEITDITNGVITLDGAAAMVGTQQGAAVENAGDIVGGALVNMGNESGTSNYGIGVNSSDNTVNLPARAISLFKTNVDGSAVGTKVTYDYQAILGTLPQLSSRQVDTALYNTHMANTQGIYTDNMYIGNADQYIAFYTEGLNKKLKISGADIYLTAGASETLAEVIDGIEVGDGLFLSITSSGGTDFDSSDIATTLTAHLYKGGEEVLSESGSQQTTEDVINALGYQVNWYTYTEVNNVMTETLIKSNSVTCVVGPGANTDVSAVDAIEITAKLEDISNSQGD